ncbi:MAG: DoxX family protein [Aquiluna sp.]|jgi:hypothetical protein
MDLLVIVLGFAISAFTAFSFYMAGSFKLKSSKETMLAAGFGWLEKLPVSVAKTIGLLEILGAAGLILAPIGYLIGFEWAIWFAVAAGIGLALTMLGAIIVHAQRGEAKFTLKMNLQLLLVSLLSAGAWFALTLV